MWRCCWWGCEGGGGCGGAVGGGGGCDGAVGGDVRVVVIVAVLLVGM